MKLNFIIKSIMESSSKLLESITCPVCIDKVGVYALIECGHNLCSGCIRGIQNISRQIKCPICRVKVTKKPIIFRPLAEYLESGVASQMETFFNTLFNDNANTNANTNANANITNLFDYDGLYARSNTRIINNNNPGNAGNVNNLDNLSNLGQQINIEQLQLQAECEYNYNDWDISEENVMLHEIAYSMQDQLHLIHSSLVVKGEDNLRTAMAKTVGMPLGIAAMLILEGKIQLTGLHIPTMPAIYNPVLNELENAGIRFIERELVKK
jgi:hypothetical protein